MATQKSVCGKGGNIRNRNLFWISFAIIILFLIFAAKSQRIVNTEILSCQ